MSAAPRTLVLGALSVCCALAQSAAPAKQQAAPVREHNATGLPTTLPATGARLAIPGYARFADPLEQAFTIEAPSGWRTEGGLIRTGALGINPYVRTLSTDKMTYLMFGEPTLPEFAPASDIGMKLGFSEGTLYSPGFGQRVLIWHYLPGPEFARVYGQMALANLCGGLKFVSGRELPQLASTMNALVPTVIPSSSSGGEALFTCTHNRQEMAARVEAVTRITRDNVGWNAILLDGFIAPRNQASDAQTALTHILTSIQWSQAWVQKQNALSQQAAQAIQARVAQQERQQAAFIQKLNSVDENFQAMDELINGSSHYHDPRTNQDYYLNNANPFKWVDDYGRVVSTYYNIKPPLGNFHLLQHTTQ